MPPDDGHHRENAFLNSLPRSSTPPSHHRPDHLLESDYETDSDAEPSSSGVVPTKKHNADAFKDCPPIQLCRTCNALCVHDCGYYRPSRPYTCPDCKQIFWRACAHFDSWPLLREEAWTQSALQPVAMSAMASSSSLSCCAAPSEVIHAPQSRVERGEGADGYPSSSNTMNPSPRIDAVIRCFYNGVPFTSAKALSVCRVLNPTSLHREYHQLFQDEFMGLPANCKLVQVTPSSVADRTKAPASTSEIDWHVDSAYGAARPDQVEGGWAYWYAIDEIVREAKVKQISEGVMWVYVVFRSWHHGVPYHGWWRPDMKKQREEGYVEDEIVWFRRNEDLSVWFERAIKPSQSTSCRNRA